MKIKLQWSLVALLWTVLTYAQDSKTKFAPINNIKIAYKTFALENRKPNQPVLVFESGFGSGGGNFDGLFPYMSNIPSIVYDRNGIGQSEFDKTVKTDTDVIKQLHTLLQDLKINPPYLLIGHSIGGDYIRLYTSIYPDEVCGLLFIDPTDFMLNAIEDESAKKDASSKTGYQQVWTINMTAMAMDATLPEGLRKEAERELSASTPIYFKEYTTLPPLKAIPVTILISYNKPVEPYEIAMNKNLNLGINIIPWWKEYDRMRINHYSEMIAANPKSKVILLPQYSHGIHHQDPELVAKTILDIYSLSKEIILPKT
jgi:pimeloyl-ACP methyl ester carboxylesterase